MAKLLRWAVVAFLVYTAGKITGQILIENNMYPWWIAQ